MVLKINYMTILVIGDLDKGGVKGILWSKVWLEYMYVKIIEEKLWESKKQFRCTEIQKYGMETGA